MLRAMLKLRASSLRSARCIAGLGLASLLAVSVRAAPADYAPLPPAAAAASAADAVSRFLVERGLIAPAAAALPAGSGFVAQVRDRASDMVLTAMNFLGVRYKRGGNTADNGFDCSGFTRQVFETSLGLALPRRVDEQAKAPGLLAIKRDELQPGDLVFFGESGPMNHHVGMVVGPGVMIDAPHTGAFVELVTYFRADLVPLGARPG